MSIHSRRSKIPEKNPGNRRLAPRLNSPFMVSYQLQGQSMETRMALNISATGARLVLRGATPAIGSKLLVELESDLTLRGRTVWEHPMEAGECRVAGVVFEPITHNQRKALRGWLEARS